MRRGLDCSHTLKALLSPDMRRSDGTGRSKGSLRMSWVKCRTLCDGVSVALIVRFYPERVETERGNGAFMKQSGHTAGTSEDRVRPVAVIGMTGRRHACHCGGAGGPD